MVTVINLLIGLMGLISILFGYEKIKLFFLNGKIRKENTELKDKQADTIRRYDVVEEARKIAERSYNDYQRLKALHDNSTKSDKPE